MPRAAKDENGFVEFDGPPSSSAVARVRLLSATDVPAFSLPID